MTACFLQVRSREFGECGEFRGSKELVKLEECTSDIGNHLRISNLTSSLLPLNSPHSPNSLLKKRRGDIDINDCQC